jgi:hypothetical protein
MVTLPKYAGSRSWGSMDSQESADAKEKEAADAHADERRETDRDQARLGDGAKEAQWSEKSYRRSLRRARGARHTTRMRVMKKKRVRLALRGRLASPGPVAGE